ncbi:unnamed protein product [Nippostrongylus brasiliensis]|uniref:YTH domain-containing protein n=1 Tax=Nippostrongylus brasiliensis TaxID=27835 RepID=A0A0N4XXK4_NIPBR|nr:unnamed protein product [Nippostrongylus brasiliensis]
MDNTGDLYLQRENAHRPLHAVFDTGEELLLGACDSRGVGGVGVLVNTNLAMNIDSFEQHTIQIGRLRLMQHGQCWQKTVFVVYAPTSDYDDEEVKAFYMERFYKDDHSFFIVIVVHYNAKIGLRRSSEELHIGVHGLEWNKKGQRLSEFIMSTNPIHRPWSGVERTG